MGAWAARAVVALILVGTGISPAPAGAWNGTPETIKIIPRSGYSGGLIDLSGTGFKPYTRLILFMACPNYLDPTVYDDKNYIHQFGPTADANGDFAGFLFHAPTLHRRLPPIGCQLYTIVPDDGPGFAPPTAIYTVLPRSLHLEKRYPCRITMCSSVTVAPKRVRAGLRERITVTAWPGARADTVISYPRGTESHYVKHLDWQGNLSLSVPVPAGMPERASAKVTVRTTLGKMQDTKYGNFTITK